MGIEKRNLTAVERFEQSSTESRRLLNQEKLILEVRKRYRRPSRNEGSRDRRWRNALAKPRGLCRSFWLAVAT